MHSSDIPIDFNSFANSVRNNEVNYNPFIQHILEAWNQKDHENLFFTTYEDMKKDLRNVATDLVKFLGKEGTVIFYENNIHE